MLRDTHFSAWEVGASLYRQRNRSGAVSPCYLLTCPPFDVESYLCKHITMSLPISITSKGILGIRKCACKKWSIPHLIASLGHWALWNFAESGCINLTTANVQYLGHSCSFPVSLQLFYSGVARIYHLREHKPHKALADKRIRRACLPVDYVYEWRIKLNIKCFISGENNVILWMQSWNSRAGFICCAPPDDNALLQLFSAESQGLFREHHRWRGIIWLNVDKSKVNVCSHHLS